MNFKALVIWAISTCGALSTQAQSKDSVLFTLDDTPYYSAEFKRIYNKNLDLIKDSSQRDINQYLDLYVLYKLKVAKAYELKLDENPTYISELNTNRNQLAERYLTDEKLTEELVVEAYQRSLKEVNASHILFLTKSFADPADTLKAYNKALNLRRDILAGASFEEMAKKHSEDPSAKENGGALGYFSVFKMVYPFETGAYNTPVGSVSMPIRSSFGYHLIKVHAVRDFRGERSIAHLMLQKAPADALEKNKEVEAQINKIASDLKNGADFEALVKRYSQDTQTAQKGGVLPRFTTAANNAKAFEDAVFALQKPGDISQPVETNTGWHLIKLLAMRPIPSFEEAKVSMENNVKRDSRSRVINKQLLQNIKARYTVVEDHKLKKQLFGLVDDSVYSNAWVAPKTAEKFQKPLIAIQGEQVYTAMDFLTYIQQNQSAYRAVQPLSKALDLMYEKFLNGKLEDYYVANLEREFPEFDYTVKEYREGLLLFDLMEKEIWNKVQTDTLGYTAFYEKNKQHYIQRPQLELAVYDFDDAKAAKRFAKAWKKSPELVSATPTAEGVYDADSPEVIEKKLPLKPGLYTHPENSKQLIVLKSVTPERIKELDEVRAQLIQEYQEDYEKNWVAALKQQKQIKINREALEAIKREMTSE
ncbi:peptidylprolyl isomerase [Flavobacterium sp. JP2137]|uniref:peptidylprolyl isomerase n=1 Tax=Flavobacterium sp. JP2137 TaxID=3414510 RepID=UPI003D2FB6DF